MINQRKILKLTLTRKQPKTNLEKEQKNSIKEIFIYIQLDLIALMKASYDEMNNKIYPKNNKKPE